jgi:hypothetical protein
MSEMPAITCPEHNLSLVPGDPGRLRCPEDGCFFGYIADRDLAFAPSAQRFPSSPLTPLGEGAAAHHELVLTYQAAGFTRTEAMQVLLCVITASMMKDKGNG